MAGPLETRGQLEEFVDVLRRRVWQIVLPVAFLTTLGVAAAVIVPKKYKLRTQVELRPNLIESTLGTTDLATSTHQAGNAKFQITALSRIRTVVEQKLEWPEFLALEPADQHEFLTDVQEDIRVVPESKGGPTSSTFVTLYYTDVDPVRGVNFLKALRDDWIENVVAGDRKRIANELEILRERKIKLDKQYSEEEGKLTELKRSNGISATQPIPGQSVQRGEDPTFASLERNTSELDEVRLELSQLRGEIVALEEQRSLEPETVSRTQLKEGRSFEEQILLAERKLDDLRDEQARYLPAHSRYQKLQDQIDTGRSYLEELRGRVTRGETEQFEEDNPRILELTREIDELQRQVAGLEGKRATLLEAIEHDQQRSLALQEVYRQIREKSSAIASLSTSRDDAERAYQEKERQFAIMSSPEGNPFAITEQVVRPKRPTEPSSVLIVAFGLVAGLAVGVGSAVLAEFSGNSFRSVHDISRIMLVPVLGTVNTIVTRQEARQRRVRRTLVGSSSVALILAVAFLTWAWAAKPDLLSEGVKDAIEGLRSNFE